MNEQTANNNEPTTTIGLPQIPSGADGVEPLARTDYEEIITDVFHKCNEAFIHAPHQREARPGYFKMVAGDIAEAFESVVPCEHSVYKTPDAAMDVVIDNLTPDLLEKICVRHGLKKRMTHDEYMTVAPGVKLTRFKGTNAERLVAVRMGKNGNDDTLFEISVDRDNAKAVIERDGELLYQIKTLGLTDRRLTHAAINVLRSHLHENKRVYLAHREERRIRAGILTPEQEVAATVARQIDDDDLAQRIENA